MSATAWMPCPPNLLSALSDSPDADEPPTAQCATARCGRGRVDAWTRGPGRVARLLVLSAAGCHRGLRSASLKPAGVGPVSLSVGQDEAMMQPDGRSAAMSLTVEEQIESLLSEPRAGKTSLGQALAERDRDAAFDRCMVGGDNCKRAAIRAHCIPETALELIADESRKVIAAHSAPPRTAVQCRVCRMLCVRGVV